MFTKDSITSITVQWLKFCFMTTINFYRAAATSLSSFGTYECSIQQLRSMAFSAVVILLTSIRTSTLSLLAALLMRMVFRFGISATLSSLYYRSTQNQLIAADFSTIISSFLQMTRRVVSTCLLATKWLNLQELRLLTYGMGLSVTQTKKKSKSFSLMKAMVCLQIELMFVEKIY